MWRDALYYKKFSNAPFTGKVTGSQEGYIKNGKKEGVWVGYWGDGTQMLSKTGIFKKGMKIGD